MPATSGGEARCGVATLMRLDKPCSATSRRRPLEGDGPEYRAAVGHPHDLARLAQGMPVKVWPFGACSSWAGPVQWEGTGPGGGGRPTCECPAGASEVWPPAQPGGHASGMREEHREVASSEDSAQPLVLPLLFSAEPAQVAEAHASGFLLVWQDVEGNGEGDQWLSTSPVGLLNMNEQQALAVAASLSAAVAPLELHLVTGVVEMHPAYRIHVLSTFSEREVRMVSIQRCQRVVTVDPRTRTRVEVHHRETIEVPALYKPQMGSMRLYRDDPAPNVYVAQVEDHDPERAEEFLSTGLPPQLQGVPLALHAVLLEAFQGQKVVEIGEVGLWMAPDGWPMVLPAEGESIRFAQAFVAVQVNGIHLQVRGRTYWLPLAEA